MSSSSTSTSPVDDSSPSNTSPSRGAEGSGATSTTKWSAFSLFGRSKGPTQAPPSLTRPQGQQQQGGNSGEDEEGDSSGTLSEGGGLDELDMFFGQFWSEVAVFSFDRGKEIAEKEKERALKNPTQGIQGASSGFTWVIITTALAQISQIEKAYVNLTFLAPKGFLRKDSNLKTVLEAIKHDLTKIVEGSTTPLPVKHTYPEVASAILVMINLRVNMIDFYEKLSMYGTAKNIEISDLVTEMEMILERFEENQKGIGPSSLALLEGIVNSLSWECHIVCNILKATSAMQTWAYLEATVAVNAVHTNLQEWSELVQTNSTTVKKSFYSSGSSLPTLFLWLKRMKGILMSKYTLYFYELLAKHSIPAYDIKTYCTKLPVDYHSRLVAFQKKSDAVCACIVLDARGTTFYANGYRFPGGRKLEVLEGLESFPAILSIPAKPLQYWPTVVMIISDKMSELNNDKTVTIFDNSVQITYFIQKLDVRMFLLVMFESKKSEKEVSTSASKFLVDLATELKGTKTFSSLKCFKE